MKDVDYAQVEAELVSMPGAIFAHAKHAVIPPIFAPAKLQLPVSRLLKEFPFEFNVFCMSRFPKVPDDPLVPVISTLRHVVQSHGLHLHFALDKQIDDELFENVGAYMWACQYGIGILENRSDRDKGLNSNVLIELGSMLVTGRRCAILKDKIAPSPPSDLSGQIYKPVNLDDPSTVAHEAHRWLAVDLGLGRCVDCPPLP